MTREAPEPRASLVFHGIGEPARPLEPGESAYWISRPLFCDILDRVVDMGRTGPEITFDDGNMSDIEIALPELEKRGLRGSFFLLTGRLDQPGSLRRADVRSLAANGQTIGLHGHDHRDWRRLDGPGRDQEYRQARALLSELAQSDIRLAAAPFGHYDRNVVSALAREGFDALYTSDWGRFSTARFVRPRNCLDNRMTPARIDRALHGSIPMARHPRRLAGLIRKRLLPIGTQS